tara:strand:+ start:276 stop:947 length:672 start_codon:yes stop_codon:yes gene_type:complete
MSWNFSKTIDKYNLLVGKTIKKDSDEEVNQVIREKELIAAHILKELSAQKHHLVAEIGCGCGFMTNSFAQYFDKIFCCDISKSFLKTTKKYCKDFDNIYYNLLNRNEWTFTDNKSLDLIISHNVVIHFPLYEVFWFFKQTSKLLKQGGLLYFDYLSSDEVKFNEAGEFHRMFNYFHMNPANSETLFHYNSNMSIKNLCQSFGFTIIKEQKMGAENIALVLQKD